MNQLDFVEEMRANAAAIGRLVEGVPLGQARWRPSAGEWSILEVINHLLDEEKLDFRLRLGLLLADPEQDWPPNDPNGWVTEKSYNARELKPSVTLFLQEREASIEWLKSLGDVDWTIGKKTPWGGMLTAGDLFGSWVTHDYLHIRQLNQLKRAYAVKIFEPFSVDYAGDW